MVDELAKLLSSSVSITCPDSGAVVGATFTVCGMYAPSFFCPYRVWCRVYYVDANGTPRMLQNIIVPGEAPNPLIWTTTFTLDPLPAQGEDLLITARLYSSSGSPLSPTVSTVAVYDSATTTDDCAGTCAATRLKLKEEQKG